jgi:hypothetical protein
MRSGTPFDTHAYVKRLVAAGVPEEQAEVHAEFWSEMVLQRLATKDDIRALKDDLLALEERIMTKVDTKLKDLELRMTLRVGGMMTAFAAVITAVVKFL